MARLTGTHRQGAGDDGASMLLQGGRKISKGSPAAHLYGEIEWVQHAIAQIRAESHFAFYTDEHLSSPEDVEFMNWLDHAMGSLSAWVWMGGESSDHALPESALVWLNKRCEKFASEGYGASDDFVVWNCSNLLPLNALRLHIRACERWFSAWWHSDMVAPIIMARPDIAEQYKLTAAFLNRLSYWVYLVTQRYAWLMYNGTDHPVRIWAGKMPEFPFK